MTGVEYNVFCPSDGKLRGLSDTYAEARAIAKERDKDCGCCRPPDGPHTVVRREVTPWVPAIAEPTP